MTQTEEETKPIPPPPTPLKMEELIGAGRAHIKRTLIIEIDDGKELKRSIVFRRLSFKEVNDLALIPRDEGSRYTKTVVFWASIEPKFEIVDELDSLPTGFVQHYCTVILDESGKDPFLLKG